ncbi:MAG: hypothetical protein K2X80_06375 [Pseudomonadaceae bacterium]|nr:hypothetical protein [Pseudomonadaceae bacterium]
MILFLDFDGVLHPDAVYLSKRGIELRAEGELFMWSSLLSEALTKHPDIQIVLSTSWARKIGYDRARKALPPELSSRVIGATWHSAMGRGWHERILWDVQTRYNQIATYLNRRPCPMPWLAVDDDDEGWPDYQRERLVLTDGMHGLSVPGVLDELITKLKT